MKLKIAVLPGDGIGPEIMSVALDVVKATAKKFNHQLEYQTALVGTCAIDATGSPYPEETHRLCMESDAVLFGAIGSPKYDNDPTAKMRPEQGLLAMRKQLGLYANIRPVTTFPDLSTSRLCAPTSLTAPTSSASANLLEAFTSGVHKAAAKTGIQPTTPASIRATKLSASCASPINMPKNAARK